MHLPNDVSPTDWNDWRWQLRHRLRTPQDLRGVFGDRPGLDEFLRTGKAFEVGITPWFASLCDPADPACPLTRQVLPDSAEACVAPFERTDPLGEDPHRVAPGLVHKYPDRVLLLVTDTCAAYCRYCTRARWVASGTGQPDADELDTAVQWIAKHPEIADVLISGGDPLLLSTRRLSDLLDRLAAIPHLRFLRIGTRVPVFLPMRIDAELVEALRPRRIPVYVNVHINHFRELAPLTTQALAMLADAGVPLGGQTVLLRGVNDDPEVLRETFLSMLSARVRPYYLFHCDPVHGTAHLRTSVDRGLELMRALIGFTSGMAVPKYCIDLEGGGKVPLWPSYVEASNPVELRVTGFRGERFRYVNQPATLAPDDDPVCPC
jgi:lysine 2,3-aminomutase